MFPLKPYVTKVAQNFGKLTQIDLLEMIFSLEAVILVQELLHVSNFVEFVQAQKRPEEGILVSTCHYSIICAEVVR